MTAAKFSFDSHMGQCAEAIEIYEFLRRNGYSADFGLRYVWVASISALDNYISDLIIEKATEHFSNRASLSNKMLNEAVPLSGLLQIQAAPAAQALVEFRNLVAQAVRYKTFQKADDVADGLSYVWNEEHKWSKISQELFMENKPAKRKLNSIAYRRDAIVHNADYDEANKQVRNCDVTDARKVIDFINRLVGVIDCLVP